MEELSRRSLILGFTSLFFCAALYAQQPQPASIDSTAPPVSDWRFSGLTSPRLVKFGGTLRDHDGKPIVGVVGITFGLYKDQQGGTPLWLESQNVEVDSQGNYTALLGATKREGMAVDLFTSGEARWLAIEPQTADGVQQPRLLLVSVPYELKAADADTIGGKPASAFMLAPADGVSTTSQSASKTDSAPTVNAITGTGTVNVLPKWDSSGTNLVDSVVFDNNGKVGIGTSTPSQRLVITGPSGNVWTQFDSATGFNSGFIYSENNVPTGYLYHLAGTPDLRFADGFGTDRVTLQLATGNVGIGTNNPSQRLVITAPSGNVWSVFDSATGFNSGFIYSENNVPQAYLYHPTGTTDLRFADQTGADKITMQVATGRVGIGTAAPSQKLDVAGTAKVTGLMFGDNSTMTTAATISGVTAGTGLTGGAASGIASLALSSAALTRNITYLGGCDACVPLTNEDDQKTIYANLVGPMTIVSVTCFSDAGSPKINLQRDDGSAANVLTGDLTCSTSGATSTSIAMGEGTLNWNANPSLTDKLDFVMSDINGGAAHRVTVIIKTTLN